MLMALAGWATMQSYGPGAGLIGALSVWPSDGPYSLCLGPSWLLLGLNVPVYT